MDKEAVLSEHQAQSVYDYIGELEDYIQSQDEGYYDWKKMHASFNRGGKLEDGINKLNVYNSNMRPMAEA
jgi:hypothetical protein